MCLRLLSVFFPSWEFYEAKTTKNTIIELSPWSLCCTLLFTPYPHVHFSSLGPCMCLGGSPVCCSTMCLYTDPPAARPSLQRKGVWRQGRGSAASGAEAAVSPGSPAWLMAASHLPHSVPLKLVRKTSRAFISGWLDVSRSAIEWYILHFKYTITIFQSICFSSPLSQKNIKM